MILKSLTYWQLDLVDVLPFNVYCEKTRQYPEEIEKSNTKGILRAMIILRMVRRRSLTFKKWKPLGDKIKGYGQISKTQAEKKCNVQKEKGETEYTYK